MINHARHITCILLLLIVAAGIARSKEPKIAKRLYADSTTFKLAMEPGVLPTVGKSFKVRIHVAQKEHFHIWSSTMDSDDCCLRPLKVAIPDSIAGYFELTNLNELSNPVIRYDSNFLVQTKAVFGPFDIIATIKVKRDAPSASPFYMWVTYACANDSQCMPPDRCVVPMGIIGDRPLMLKIARYGKRNRRHELAVSDIKRDD